MIEAKLGCLVFRITAKHLSGTHLVCYWHSSMIANASRACLVRFSRSRLSFWSSGFAKTLDCWLDWPDRDNDGMLGSRSSMSVAGKGAKSQSSKSKIRLCPPDLDIEGEITLYPTMPSVKQRTEEHIVSRRFTGQGISLQRHSNFKFSMCTRGDKHEALPNMGRIRTELQSAQGHCFRLQCMMHDTLHNNVRCSSVWQIWMPQRSDLAIGRKTGQLWVKGLKVLDGTKFRWLKMRTKQCICLLSWPCHKHAPIRQASEPRDRQWRSGLDIKRKIQNGFGV